MKKRFLLISSCAALFGVFNTQAKQTDTEPQKSSTVWEEFDSMHKEFAELHKQMDTMFEKMSESFEEEHALRIKSAPLMEEKDDNLIIKINLPSIDPKTLNIKIEDNILRIIASKQQEKDDGKIQFLKARRFEIIRTLPYPVTVEATKAEYENGTLTITMHKEQSKTSIPVTIK